MKFCKVLLLFAALWKGSNAQRGGGGGRGGGHGGGRGGERFRGDTTSATTTTTTTSTSTTPVVTSSSYQDTIQFLMQNRDKIERDVEDKDFGVKTITNAKSGEDKSINDWIYHHVMEMKALVESGGRIRDWDDLFEKMYEYANDLELTCSQDGEQGPVECEHVSKSENDCASGLAQAHAEIVQLFLDNGPSEVRQDHGDYIPASC